jgi:hypothetical protein
MQGLWTRSRAMLEYSPLVTLRRSAVGPSPAATIAAVTPGEVLDSADSALAALRISSYISVGPAPANPTGQHSQPLTLHYYFMGQVEMLNRSAQLTPVGVEAGVVTCISTVFKWEGRSRPCLLQDDLWTESGM